MSKGPMSSTLIQAVRMDFRGGQPEEVLKRLPAMAAAFREMGWHCEIIIEGAETMRKIILEQAEQQHKNDQKEKGTKEPFDASIFEGTFPPDKKYVTQVSLAPPWIEAAYPELAPVSMSDFAHCEQTKDSMFPGCQASRVAQDSNLGVVDVMHLRLCGNEDEQGWTRLNEATNSVLPE